MPEMDEGRISIGGHSGPTVPEENNIDRIRKRARELWQKDGCPAGGEGRYWRQAEEEILGPESRPG